MTALLCSSFGQAVKAQRDARRWSQERLALLADLDRSYVGEIERGVVVPSLVTLKKLADALDLSTSALLADSERIQQSRVAPAIHLMAIAR